MPSVIVVAKFRNPLETFSSSSSFTPYSPHEVISTLLQLFNFIQVHIFSKFRSQWKEEADGQKAVTYDKSISSLLELKSPLFNESN